MRKSTVTAISLLIGCASVAASWGQALDMGAAFVVTYEHDAIKARLLELEPSPRTGGFAAATYHNDRIRIVLPNDDLQADMPIWSIDGTEAGSGKVETLILLDCAEAGSEVAGLFHLWGRSLVSVRLDTPPSEAAAADALRDFAWLDAGRDDTQAAFDMLNAQPDLQRGGVLICVPVRR